MASVAAWRWVEPGLRPFAYAGIDAALAAGFLRMSRRRWFPVPLFLLHGALIVYHLYAALIEATTFWVGAFLNRAFELALAYVAACAAYRIAHRARKEKGAPKKARPR